MKGEITMPSSGKPIVRVKNMLGDDVYGLWHVKKIVVQKGWQRYAIIPHKQTFSTKDEAVHYAHSKARRLVEYNLQKNKKNPVQWRLVMKYFCAAGFIAVMTPFAVQWWRGELYGERADTHAASERLSA